MIDQTKRNSLKAIGVATAAAALPSPMLMASTAFEKLSLETGNAIENLGISDLKIEIITSNSVKHNTVILSNLSEQTIAVKHFKPGTVIWGDQYLDLNGLRGHVGLNLAPGSAMNLSVHRQSIHHAFQSEYIRADDAITTMDKNAHRILLGACLSDGQLLAYPIPFINKLT